MRARGHLDLDEILGNRREMIGEDSKALLDADFGDVSLLNVPQGLPDHGHVESRAKLVLKLVDLDESRCE